MEVTRTPSTTAFALPRFPSISCMNVDIGTFPHRGERWVKYLSGGLGWGCGCCWTSYSVGWKTLAHEYHCCSVCFSCHPSHSPNAQGESGVCSRVSFLLPTFRDGVAPSYITEGQSQVYQVTQLRTDGVHRREPAGTGPIAPNVVRVTWGELPVEVTLKSNNCMPLLIHARFNSRTAVEIQAWHSKGGQH